MKSTTVVPSSAGIGSDYAARHYFRSKDEVLESIFRDTWQRLVTETERIEASGAPFPEQLRQFAQVYLGSWLMTPASRG